MWWPKTQAQYCYELYINNIISQGMHSELAYIHERDRRTGTKEIDHEPDRDTRSTNLVLPCHFRRCQ